MITLKRKMAQNEADTLEDRKIFESLFIFPTTNKNASSYLPNLLKSRKTCTREFQVPYLYHPKPEMAKICLTW